MMKSLTRSVAIVGTVALLGLTAPGARSETVTYTYDVLGRLVSASTSGGHTTTYSYDLNGNRTQVVVTGGSNTAPTAATDAQTTALNTAISFDPRTNDSDPNGDALTITAKTNGSNGTVTITGGGTGLTYTPTTGFSGSTSFTYTISDGSLTAVGTVNMTVTSTVADGTVLYTKSTGGSFSFTIPAGVSYVDLEGWGAGSDGRTIYVNEEPIELGGSGGGYFKKKISVTQGQTIAGNVASGSGTSTTVTGQSLTANSGNGSSGGTASGGTVNTTGTGCCYGNLWNGGGAGNGGGDVSGYGDAGSSPGGGGAGDAPFMNSHGAGAPGRIKITARTS